MNRKEAERYVGRPVRAWTAANGVYVGILERVVAKPGRPWRGVVRVTGILKPAHHFEWRGGACRRGFRVGETLEAGGVNITPTDETGMASYLEALERERAKVAAWLARDRAALARLERQAAPEDAPVHERARNAAWLRGSLNGHAAMLRALDRVIAAERHRLATGEWRPDDGGDRSEEWTP